MHELSLAQGVVDIVTAAARAEGFTRIVRVRVAIGALAIVEPDALALGFDAASRGTPAEGAIFDVDRPPGEGLCTDCGAAVPLAQRGDACPRCGGFRVMVTSGEDLRVVDVEVE